MLTWIFAVLGLYLFNLLLVSYLRFTESGLSTQEAVTIGLGPRDNLPQLGVLGGRADRALVNLKESLPFFLTLALLCIATGKVNPQAVNGAMIFAFARFAYLPSYMWGLPGLRSAVWVVAMAGLVMMLSALFQTAV